MSHKKFYELVDQVPRVASLWDRDDNSFKSELYEKEQGVMSPGELAMAQFFISIWFNHNERYGFDLSDAISYIDPPEKKLIINWIENPFWP